MNSITLRLVVFHLLVGQLFFAQEQGFKIPDSLQDKTYEELKNIFIQNADDKTKSSVYAKSILAKGKIEKDTSNILLGFSLLTHVHSKNDSILFYSDSIIKIAKKASRQRYIGLGNLNKAEHYFERLNFKKSLDHYLIAKEYYKDDARLNFIIDHAIGLLKTRLGDEEEALEIFKESWEYVNKENFREKDNDSYLIALFSLANNYCRVGKYDSASIYNKLGIKESLLAKNKIRYNRFVLNEGYNNYYKKNYDAAFDSLSKAISNLDRDKDKPNLIVGHFYRGKILYINNEYKKAIREFKRVDTLFIETGDIIPEARENYELLINYYKKNNDLKSQLLYIERLIKVDSILNDNYRYLSKTITQKYDTPKLVSEKEKIINSLKNEKKNSYLWIFALSITSLVAISLWVLNYYKRKAYKKRFEELLSKADKEEAAKKKDQYKDDKSIGISEDIVKQILSCLDTFEEKQRYLEPDITIMSLAKDCNTNVKYLSKVINFHKKKSFSVYINELRIDYVVEKLKNDKILRHYAVNAIAGEAGFNTTEAFSKSFLKKTGIYPSYFIKELEKRKTS